MRKAKLIGLAGVLLAGCGHSYPTPNDQMAAATRDVGRAQEAASVPAAKLHLQLAQEDLSNARQLMDVDNRRAATLLQRSRAESQYAISLSREAQAKGEANQATDELMKVKQGGK